MNCTVVSNHAFAGTNGAGGPLGCGGRLPPLICGTNGPPGQPGLAAGALSVQTAGFHLANTIIAFGTNGANCWGLIEDHGGNLSSDASCAFAAPTSYGNIDPLLGPLADLGGSTQVMPLQDGSPALNGAVNAFAPVTDQRGMPRSRRRRADIGAFENQYDYIPIIELSPSSVGLMFEGIPLRSYVLEFSSDLRTWNALMTNAASASGLVQFLDDNSHFQRFYRTVGP